MYLIRKVIIWLYRWRHSRGFGVQSPNDYSFIRYVINEHYPYYAYDDLRKAMPDVSALHRKKAELLFRIANMLQPEDVFLTEKNDVYASYIKAGCNKARINVGIDDVNKRCLIVASLTESNHQELTNMVQNVNKDSIVVVDEIYSGDNFSLWEMLINEDAVVITYDLYYVGLLFFDKTRYKLHYKINF